MENREAKTMKDKMRLWALIAVLGIWIQASIVSAGQAKDWPEGLRDFIFFYYKEPKPNELEKRLGEFLNSGIFNNGQLSDSDDLMLAYFFARAGGKDPNIVRGYTKCFENGKRDQRIFVLKVLKLCGNDETKKRLKELSEESKYINQRQEIEYIISRPMPADINITGKPVSDARNLRLLKMEFVATGEDKAILRMIEALETQGTILSFFKPRDFKNPKVIRETAKAQLISHCRIHDKALSICKQEYEKSKGPARAKHEEIIEDVDGSISVDRWLKSKPQLKPVTSAQGWALGCSAVLIERNHGWHDTLSPEQISEKSVRDELKLLSRWWDVRTKKELLDSLEWLEQGGHRKGFEKTGELVAQMSDEEFLELLEQNKDNKDKINKYETARKYYKQLGNKGLKGWDFARYICLCRWGYHAGFLNEQEAWGKIMPVAMDLQKTFDSWEDLGKNYLIGRSYWSYEEQEEDGYKIQDAFQRLVDMKSSPWNIYKWDMDLNSPGASGSESTKKKPQVGEKK